LRGVAASPLRDTHNSYAGWGGEAQGTYTRLSSWLKSVTGVCVERNSFGFLQKFLGVGCFGQIALTP
jgi:hypothetical protein